MLWKEKLGKVLREVVGSFNDGHPKSFRGYSYRIADSIADDLDFVLTSDECRAIRKLAAELEVPIQFSDYNRVSGTKCWRGWCLYAKAEVTIKDDVAEVLVRFWEDKTKAGYDRADSAGLEVPNLYRKIYWDDAKKYVKDIERFKLLSKAVFKVCKPLTVVKTRGKKYLVLLVDKKLYVFEVKGRAGRKGAKYLVDIAGKTLWRTDKTLLSRYYVESWPLEVKKKLLELLV